MLILYFLCIIQQKSENFNINLLNQNLFNQEFGKKYNPYKAKMKIIIFKTIFRKVAGNIYLI